MKFGRKFFVLSVVSSLKPKLKFNKSRGKKLSSQFVFYLKN